LYFSGRNDVVAVSFMPLFSKSRDPELYAQRHGLYFAFYNALNWQVGAGVPTVLFMEYIGADSFQAGLVYGWTLLLTPVQVFATMWLPRLGFKKLTMAGWGARGWFLVAPLALAIFGPDRPQSWMVTTMVLAMFFYSLSRAIGSAAITTWITALVPSSIRGRYWSTDQMMGGTAAVGTLVVCTAMFAILPARWAFTVQYLIAIGGAWMAYRCLKLLPDIERPKVMSLRKILTDTPRHLFSPGPFRPYLWLTVLYFVVMTPLAPFGAFFLKSTVGLSAKYIMLYTMFQYVGAIAGNWFMRSRIDRTGAKPFLRVAFIIGGLLAVGWFVCLHVPGLIMMAMPALFFLLGAGSGIFTAANVNYLAKILPENDRALPLSLHGALAAFIGGLSPVVWGAFLKHSESGVQGMNLAAFQTYFVVTVVGSGILVLLVNRLHEAEGHVDPLLSGSWLFRPFRAVTNLINLAEAPRRKE
jgi:MFS family permease